MRRVLVIVCCAALAGCATTQHRPEPEIRTVEVKVKTPVPCPALAALGDEPVYSDSEEALRAAATIADTGERTATLAKLYVKGRLQRMQRLKEYTVAKASCLF